MKTHAREGHTLLSHSRSQLHKLGAVIALEHHERWDGSGYPQNLRGEQISQAGRIAAVADVLDCLINNSCYKKASSLAEAFAYMNSQSGKHFDPELIALLNSNRQAIEKIYAN